MPTECRYAEYKVDLAVEAMCVGGLVYTDETRKESRNSIGEMTRTNQRPSGLPPELGSPATALLTLQANSPRNSKQHQWMAVSIEAAALQKAAGGPAICLTCCLDESGAWRRAMGLSWAKEIHLTTRKLI